jgi:Tol biopolymer transport system component
MDANGSNETRLTTSDLNDESPAWSPDGDKIIFDAGTSFDGIQQLYIMNADGSNRINISNNTLYNFSACW